MDFNKLMQEAQKMQAQMQKAQKELENKDFVGEASNGLVKVTVNGSMRVKEVAIDPEIVNKDDIEMLQDMIVIAFNEAIAKIEEASESNLGSLTKGLKF